VTGDSTVRLVKGEVSFVVSALAKISGRFTPVLDTIIIREYTPSVYAIVEPILVTGSRKIRISFVAQTPPMQTQDKQRKSGRIQGVLKIRY
jgi:hypothetical protein